MTVTREEKLILLKAIDDALDFQQQKAFKNTQNETREIQNNPEHREAITIVFTDLAKKRVETSRAYRLIREKLINEVGAE